MMVVVESEVVAEVWLIISKQHAVTLMQPGHSKVKVVMAEAMEASQEVQLEEETEEVNLLKEHLKARRTSLMASAVAEEGCNLSTM